MSNLIAVKQIRENELTDFVNNLLTSGLDTVSGVSGVYGYSGIYADYSNGTINIAFTGEAGSVENVLYITGEQTISGFKDFESGVRIGNKTFPRDNVFYLKDNLYYLGGSGGTYLDIHNGLISNTNISPGNPALININSGYLNTYKFATGIFRPFVSLDWINSLLRVNTGVTSFTTRTSLDWSQRILSGDWLTNTTPTQSGHLINYGYISGRTGAGGSVTGTTNFITTSGSNPTYIDLSTSIASNSNVIYVSKSINSTNDRTNLNKYDPNRPFTRLNVAQDVAVSGDTIVVLPGTYINDINDEDPYINCNLGKNGVNWYFLPGAKIDISINSDFLPPFPLRYIFGDTPSGTSTPMSYTVDGLGEFFNIDNDGSMPVFGLYTSNSGSNIIMNCKSITVQNSVPQSACVHCINGNQTINVNSLFNYNGGYGASCLNGTQFIKSVNIVTPGTTTLYCENGLQTTYSDVINGRQGSVQEGGEQNIYARLMTGIIDGIVVNAGTHFSNISKIITQGICMDNFGGNCTLIVDSATAGGSNPCVVLDNNPGTYLKLKGKFVAGSNSNAITIPGSSNSPVLILDGVTLIANGIGKSINQSVGTLPILVYNSVANKDTVGITVRVGNLVVSNDVI